MRTRLRMTRRRRGLSEMIAANLARPNSAPPVDLLQILMGEPS